MQRYFVNNNNIRNDEIYIDGDDYFHITRVMRMKKGDKVIACNEVETWICEIVSFFDNIVITKKVEQLYEKKEMPIKITIAHGIVRREKMEEVVDKITQLGAFCYLPVMMDFCNAKLSDDKLDKKLERMRKIAKEASEQSHRTSLLRVLTPVSFKNLIKMKTDYDLCLYAYEVIDKDIKLKEVLSKYKFKSVLILIGPEGGISDNEVNLLNENEFIPISLGPRILRTEVAPLYFLSAISYELEEL